MHFRKPAEGRENLKLPEETLEINRYSKIERIYHRIIYTLSLLPFVSTLEHRTSVKRFISLQFLDFKTVGRTP
jgi:hypothetical protein